MVQTNKISIDQLEDNLFSDKQIQVAVLRLDKIHPVISGNKLFKLHYFVERAIHSSHKTILTFGGAYSNHLVATAFACKMAGLRSVAIVRGEEPERLSHTLQDCIRYGMELKFVSRSVFKTFLKNDLSVELKNTWGDCEIVPEGGYHPLGAAGAGMILDLVKDFFPTHICCDIGTATTIAGILAASKKDQKIIGVNVLKGMKDIKERIQYLTENKADLNRLEILDDYHFGGYAKKSNELIDFMNHFYKKYSIPTDFVYTGKLMFGIMDRICHDKFPADSKILCIHTGGLQGNLSLPVGRLNF